MVVNKLVVLGAVLGPVCRYRAGISGGHIPVLPTFIWGKVRVRIGFPPTSRA